MTEHEVVIAGGGPTGLMLAAELALAKVDVAIVERRANQEVAGSRAGGLHSRTLEAFDQRGIVERFLSQGVKNTNAVHFHIPLDMSDFPTRHPYSLALWQKYTEATLAGWVEELGVPIHRSRDVVGFTQDDQGVSIDVSDGSVMRAQYLVGCDGGRSIVRKTAGIDFPGWDASTSWVIAEFEYTEEPQWGFRENEFGIHAIGRADNPALARVALMEREAEHDSEPTLRDVKDTLIAVYGTDFGAHSPPWVSRFTDMARQAAAYRDRRVLLAGDAAHIHAPLGGQGLNLGVQDAVNLGWKLAQVIRGTSPGDLLDTYHNERHPVAARVLQNTMAGVAVRRTDARSKALGNYFTEFLRMDEPRKRMIAELSGLGVRYDFGEGHPLLGRRMPDLEVVTSTGPRRVFTWLHEARPLLLNFGEPGSIGLGHWASRVQLADVEYSGAWELPAIGVVSAPIAVLVRPDGYVAWVGESSSAGPFDALARWFGEA